MGEVFFKRLFLLLLLVVSLFVFMYALRNNETASKGIVTGMITHPLYPSFSSAESGFTFNNNTNVVSVSDSAIYGVGYYSINSGSWQSFNLAGTPYSSGSSWLTGASTATLPSFGVGEHYVIIYSCTYSSSWDCRDSKWQLIVVNNTVSSPLSVAVFASSFETGNAPSGAYDNNWATRWSAQGIGEWIQFNFSIPQTFNQISMVYPGEVTRIAYFNISVSNNGVSWNTVYSGQSSGSSVQGIENFSFANVTASYLRIIGRGNSVNTWNSYNEISWALVSSGVIIPTCNDGKQNGDETGVDCGGSSCSACAPSCTPSCTNKQCGSDGCTGSCGTCTNSYGSTSCSGAGLCVPVCNSGYGNCDLNNVNGCETQLGTTTNCASCGNACSGGQICTNNICTTPPPAVCGDGQCNGAETCSSCSNDCGACVVPGSYLRTFYVSNNGNNTWSGRAPAWNGTDGPWQNISKINSYTGFQPGDGILFERGGTWRETLEVPASAAGTAAKYVTFSNYGSSSNPKPRILGSKATTTWTNNTGYANVWKTDITFSSPPSSADIIFRKSDNSGSFGVNKALGSLTAEYDWAYSSNYIYVYSTANPAIAYAAIEVPQRNYCVSTNDVPYLHFDGIDVLYCAYTGYDSNNDHEISDVHGFIIENCEIGWIGGQTSDDIGYGIATIYSDIIIRNNSVHNCGRRGLAMDAYGNGFTFENILIEYNALYDGYHTTGVDMDMGSGYNININNVTIRRNFIYESLGHYSDSSNLIFIQNNNPTTNYIRNVYIYDNIFKNANGAISTEAVDGLYVYNNVFYEHTSTVASWAAFIMPQDDTKGQHVHTNSVVKNNIFFGGESSSFTAMEVWGTWNVHDYNLFYNAGDKTETHRISGNPNFVNAANNDFHLKAGSIAIGKGIAIPEVATDYAGQIFNNPPSIGAFEYH